MTLLGVQRFFFRSLASADLIVGGRDGAGQGGKGAKISFSEVSDWLSATMCNMMTSLRIVFCAL